MRATYVLAFAAVVSGCAGPAEIARQQGDYYTMCRILSGQASLNPSEMNALGVCHANGYYVTLDRQLAFSLWTQAARQGSQAAATNLAKNGQTVPATQHQSAGPSDAALGLMLLQAARPQMPPPMMQPPRDCTSFINGNVVRTSCY